MSVTANLSLPIVTEGMSHLCEHRAQSVLQQVEGTLWLLPLDLFSAGG